MNQELKVTSLLQYDITRCYAEWKVPPAIYTYHRFYYIYSGEVWYESAGSRIQLERDCFYLFPVHKEYALTHHPDQPLHCMWFHLNLNHTLLNQLTRFPVKSGTALFHLQKVLEGLIVDEAQEPLLISVLNALLLLLRLEGQLQPEVDEKLGKVIDYIRNHYQSSLNNGQLAALVNHETKYFIRLFKKTYGKTPHEYIASYRAYMAASFLLEDIQVKEVAQRVGFEDVKAFSRFFKSERGISPSLYKKSHYLQP